MASAALLVAALACGGDARHATAPLDPSPPTPPRVDSTVSAAVGPLAAVSGNEQKGTCGSMVERPLVVQLRTVAGAPLPGAAVRWTAAGGGTVTPASPVTDSAGLARAFWELGTAPGLQTVVATAAGSPDTVTFTASAEVVAEPLFGELEVLQLETPDGTGQVVHPDVVTTPRGWGSGERRHLAITPYTFGSNAVENPSVYVGSDGHSWSVAPGVRNPIVTPATGYLSDPDQLWVPESDELWLYYRHVADAANIVRLVRSSDGVKWSAPIEVVRAPGMGLISPTVVRRGPGDWMMWSVNGGISGCGGPSTTVELRRSADGLKWGAPTAVSLAQGNLFAWHLDVRWIPKLGQYWALYPVKHAGDCNTAEVYLATSTDGVQWTTYPNPVLRSGAIPEFRDVVYRSSFEFHPTSDAVSFYFSGAVWNGSTNQFTWSAATQRLDRSQLFDALTRPADLRLDRRGPDGDGSRGRRRMPLLTDETAP